MKKTFIDIMQRQGLRLSLCALTLGCSTAMMAQDDIDGDEETTTAKKAPQPRVIADKTPLMTVTGVVVDQVSKSPVVGVRVQALGNKRYTAMTDEKGQFTVKVPTFTTSLYVQSPTHAAQQVAINDHQDKQRIRVTMLSNKFNSMYGEGTDYTAKRAFTVKGGGIIIDDEIQQNLNADVRGINRSGVVDGGNAMFIRGLNSLNANAQPMIIIDGVEQDMQIDCSALHLGHFNNMLANFSPEDIEKVTVLKNATALYGARGGNGVILIQTKRGHSMATRIDANISAGITLKPAQFTMMNAGQYRNYATEMLGTVAELRKSENRGLTFNFLNDDPNGYYYNMYHNDTDWQKEVYRTAITQNYNINVQGGDDIGMYNLSVGYVMADNAVKKTGFDRLNVRFNTDIQLLKNLTTKFDMSFSRTNNTLFDDGFAGDLSANAVLSPTNLALIKSPLVTPYQYNKRVGGFTDLLSDYDQLFSPLSEAIKGNDYAYSLANPTAIIENGEGDNKNKVENTYFNVHVAPTFTFNDHLSATTMFSYVLNRNAQRYYRPTEGVAPFEVSGLGVVYNKTASLFGKENNIQSNTHIDWNNQYGAHSIGVMGGFRYTYFSYDNSDASTQFKTSQSDKNPYLSSDVASGFADIKGVNDVWKNMQWYASADYSYMNRYFATVSLSAEANSRFGDNAGGLKMFGTVWALFPSVQLGWVMSNEKWFPKNAGINYLRINAGFDMSGNDGISNYATLTSFTSVRYNNTAIGMQMTNIGNDKVKWETTTKWNLGLQAYMLNNRLGISFDYYIHNTKDLLTVSTFESPVAGIGSYWTNNGALKNTGFEMTVSGKPVVTKDWNLEIGASVGHYKNKVTELPSRSFTDGVKTYTDGTYMASMYGDNNILISKGNPLGLFYGYRTEGVFASDAEASNANGNDYLYLVDATGAKKKFEAGDVHFTDMNGDGVIDENDKVIIGDPNPDIYGNIFATLSWKNLTLDLGFNYSLGNDVYNYQRMVLNSGSNFYNQQVAETGRWRYEGQVTNLPKATFGDPMDNNRFSDRWIEDGSYLRLKKVRLTYQFNIPESWQSWLQGISIWGEAQNVFTLTKYTGIDPEFSAGSSVISQGIDNGMLAQSRAFVLGLKINL